MVAPTTQEEIDRRDNMASKVQIVSDIMNIVSGIEDYTAKLKILKSLLSNTLVDTEVIQVIQDEIDRIESEQESQDENEPVDISELGSEEPEESEEPGDALGLRPRNISEPTDMSEPEEINTEPETSSEDKLPSPSELNIDFADNNAE